AKRNPHRRIGLTCLRHNSVIRECLSAQASRKTPSSPYQAMLKARKSAFQKARNSAFQRGIAAQKSPTYCPSPMLPRICHVCKLMESRTKRTEQSARQTFTPPGCWLREGTIPTQLSQDKPAPPTPAPPAPF